MILITGANGLIGSFLLKNLLNLGFKAKGLVRPYSDLGLLNTEARQNLVEADLLDLESLETAFEDITTVVHTAAVVSFHSRDIETMHRVNIEGTKNLVNTSLKYGINYFLHLSSVSALGTGTNGIKIDEKVNWKSEETSKYGESKFQGELEVWRAYAEGLPALILCPSTTLGPGDWNRSSTQLFKYAWEENKYYSEGILNYIDLRDLTDIIIQFLKEKKTGEKYIVSAGSVRYKEFFDKVANNFSVNPPWKKITRNKAKIAVLLAKIQSLFTGKKPFITKEVARNSLSEHIYDNSRIKKSLNFDFRSLDDSIKWTCEGLLKKNLIKSGQTT